MNSLSSFRKVVRRIEINQRRVPSRFIVPMNRSMTAMLPCFPTAPNRGLIVRLRHQALKPSPYGQFIQTNISTEKTRALKLGKLYNLN